ncbi:hypothetical protein L6172_08490 [Thalassospiraceae bacterium SW-3-3]|nr:hypothetical protein L6172_08490 [Thalassospiraceae bacterium SW-3-3]
MIDSVVASSATPLQMWVVLALVAGSLVLYGLERISLELTSMALVATLCCSSISSRCPMPMATTCLMRVR